MYANLHTLLTWRSSNGMQNFIAYCRLVSKTTVDLHTKKNKCFGNFCCVARFLQSAVCFAGKSLHKTILLFNFSFPPKRRYLRIFTFLALDNCTLLQWVLCVPASFPLSFFSANRICSIVICQTAHFDIQFVVL